MINYTKLFEELGIERLFSDNEGFTKRDGKKVNPIPIPAGIVHGVRAVPVGPIPRQVVVSVELEFYVLR